MKTLTWKKISAHNHTGSGNGVQLGANALSSSAVTTAKLAAGAVTNEKLGTDIRGMVGAFHEPTGATQNLDFSTGKLQIISTGFSTGNITLTFSNTVEGMEYTIIIGQIGVQRVFTWPSDVRWQGATEPTNAQSNNTFCIIKMIPITARPYTRYLCTYTNNIDD
jgi:hypothetical protein